MLSCSLQEDLLLMFWRTIPASTKECVTHLERGTEGGLGRAGERRAIWGLIAKSEFSRKWIRCGGRETDGRRDERSHGGALSSRRRRLRLDILLFPYMCMCTEALGHDSQSQSSLSDVFQVHHCVIRIIFNFMCRNNSLPKSKKPEGCVNGSMSNCEKGTGGPKEMENRSKISYSETESLNRVRDPILVADC